MLDKRFLSLDDLNSLPAPQWLIDGLFEKSSLVMLAGPSYSFKSFLLLDWLLCMASGRRWLGRKTETCKVAYALGEGKSSLIKRIHAWIKHNDLDEEELLRLKDNFRITFEVSQLASKASVDNMLADLEKEGFKPEVIAVDTFARSFVGLDENNAKDTGLWVESADRLRQLGYAVVFLHHTKKNTEFGTVYRGSTAIMGAMDTAMTLIRDDEFCTMTVNKQKDHDEGPPMRFKRKIVILNSKGDSSCVLQTAPIVDERFEEGYENPTVKEVINTNLIVAEIMEDATYASDADRARALAKRTGLKEDTAAVRISRENTKRKQHGTRKPERQEDTSPQEDPDDSLQADGPVH